MKINCIIVENEPLAVEKVKRYIEKFSFLHLLGIYNNGLDALSFLKSNHVDLVFLDINMSKLSGIELLESTKITSQVIITTAYQEFALKGYELNVTDYLLKPFSIERFSQAIEKVKSNYSKTEGDSNKRYLFVKTEYRVEKIQLEEIFYIEGMGNYRRIHCTGKRIMTLQTFKDFEQDIPRNIICRVHKSFMVSIDKIESIEREKIKIKDVLIPISDSYKKELFDILELLKK